MHSTLRYLILGLAGLLISLGAGCLEVAPDAADVDPAAYRASKCRTLGDGSPRSQCCIWAEKPCRGHYACYWSGADGAGPNDGRCFLVGFGEVGGACRPSWNDCVPGAFCVADSPDATTGTCRALCDPEAATCDSACTVLPGYGDGSVGFEIPTSATAALPMEGDAS